LVDPRIVRESVARGKRWTEENVAFHDNQIYVYYYMYTLERCMSMLEMVEGVGPGEPRWYNDGFAYLLATQRDDGSWIQMAGPAADTPMAVLFLIRSMKRRLQRQQGYGPGLLTGGRGLPDDSAAAAGAEASDTPGEADPIAQLLAAVDIAGETDPSEASLAQLLESTRRPSPADRQPPTSAESERLDQIIRLGSPDARVVATRLLGQSGQLDDVPTLIHALTDPDVRVAIAARDGLRRISRKVDGFGLSDQPDFDQRRRAAEAWSAWYDSIRPGSQ
jgi:hypothetical protein